MKDKKIVSRLKKSNFIYLGLGILISIFGTCYFFYDFFRRESFNYVLLIIGVLFLIFVVVCFYGLFSIEEFILKNDRLVIQKIFNKQKSIINLSDIESYTVIKKQNKYSSWEDLTIFTDNSRYLLSSYSIENYFIFRKILTKGKKKNRLEEDLWYYKDNRKNGILLIVIGLFLSGLFGNMFLNRNNEVLEQDLVAIEGILINPLKIQKKRKSGRFLDIKLRAIPQITFKLGSLKLKATSLSILLNEVKVGDHIKLSVLKKSYTNYLDEENRIEPIRQMNITVYEIAKGDKKYLKVKDYNRVYKKDRNSISMYLMILLSLSFLVGGIYIILTGKRPTIKKI